jgi:2-phosphosulfolactate phosphatase
MTRIKVHLLPKRAKLGELTGNRVVVIDVLRATTTIVQALASGAECVMPFASVDDALAAAKETEPTPLLCGERYGFKIDGFDLGNSPAEYTTENVGGRPLILTTTNGTRAMTYCRAADQILLGAFTNLTAICRELVSCDECHLVCAGTDGDVTKEDALLAGAIIDGVAGAVVDGAGGELAQQAWQRVDPVQLAQEFETTAGGINLVKIGMRDDLVLAAAIDRHSLVPVYDANQGVVRALGS